MKITKVENDLVTYIELKEDLNKLTIYPSNNDLYMSITDGRRLEKYSDDFRFMDICKRDDDIYNAFNNLYNGIMLKSKGTNTNLIGEDNSIVWISDGEKEESEDILMIFKQEDFYRLLFVRNNNHKERLKKRKSSQSIDIKFSTTDSRYKDFVGYFINVYNELQNIEKSKIYKK